MIDVKRAGEDSDPRIVPAHVLDHLHGAVAVIDGDDEGGRVFDPRRLSRSGRDASP